MPPRFLTVDGLDVEGRRILVRADLNVPLESGEVGDDFRIRATLPTVERLRGGSVVVLCSHLGRPDGRDPSLAMDPVADRLAELGGFPVRKLDAVVGPKVEEAAREASPGDVLLLENTRFEAGETRNDPALAEGLARIVERFVLDAFGSAHRAHASTVGVAHHLRSAAGPLVEAEVRALTRLLEGPEHPYVVILGGAKVSDKLGVMRSLLPRVDRMLVGGGMCFTLLAARGHGVGRSLLEESGIDEVRELLESEHGERIVLPTDVVVGEEMDPGTPSRVVGADAIPPDGLGLDVGPETADRFAREAAEAASVFWNGPMGVFEWRAFRSGTTTVADGVGRSAGFTVAGGGDTIAALRLLGMEDRLSHLSTGGGAGLEFLEGKTLPGLAALERWAPNP